MKDILTTTDAAKLLGLHANTLKNWAREGKLPSFRTLGGHYRIRVDELVEALKAKGIPVPAELAGGCKTVFIVHPEESVRDGIEQQLKSAGSIMVAGFKSGIEALMALGSQAPCALIWNTGQEDVDTSSMARTLLSGDQTKNISLILLCNSANAARLALPEDLGEIPVYSYPDEVAGLVDRVRNSTV